MAEYQLPHAGQVGNEHLGEEQLFRSPQEDQFLREILDAGKCDPADHVARRIFQWGISLSNFAEKAGVALDDLLKLLHREPCSVTVWFAIERNTGPRLGYYMER